MFAYLLAHIYSFFTIFQYRRYVMRGAFYSDLDPHDWIKDHLHLKKETTEVVFGFFVLWIALMLFSYVVSFVIYWVLMGLGIIEKSLHSLLIASFS